MIIKQSDICGKRLTEIKENLVSDTKSILNWFRLNSLKANPGKFQFMILGDKSHHKHELKINSIKVEASDDVLLLGITIDTKITFKQYVENLCWKAQYKLDALRRIRIFLTIEKAKMLGNAFINSLFNYAPLLWIDCNWTRTQNHLVLKRTLNDLAKLACCYDVLQENIIKP